MVKNDASRSASLLSRGQSEPAADHRRTPASAILRHVLLAAIFALSGACGLGYEALWARYVGLFLGNTVLLHMAVLAAFMAGLSAGSFLLGARAGRAGNPLIWYASMELGISLYAFALPHLAVGCRAAVVQTAGAAGGETLVWMKLALAAALLLPPAFLMGGTYPAMVAAWNRTSAAPDGAALLYAVNCAGAVGGVLLVGLWLIPAAGLAATTRLLASLGALAGIGAIGLVPLHSRGTAPPERRAVLAKSLQAGLLAAMFCSGAAAFIYELVWTRLFALTLGSSTYSFTLMLAAFITGLALGSFAVAWVPGLRRTPVPALVAAEGGIAAIVAASIPMYQRMPYWFWVLRWQLRPTEDTVGLYHAFQYLATLGVMVLPTFLFGVTFPLAVSACALGNPRAEEAAAARVYGWNTAGTLAGVLLAGLWLVPALGLRGTLMVGVACNVAAAILASAVQPAGSTARGLATAAAVTAGVALCLGPDWSPFAFAQGAYRYRTRPPSSWGAFVQDLASHKVVFRTEDFGTTVSVVDGPAADGNPERLLVVDGKTDASAYGDLPTEILLGQVPMLLHPDARNVFVVGLGSGVTVGSVLTHPVDLVDCAEVSRGVVQAEPYFDRANGWIRRDPRLHILLEDGRMALAASPRRYDVIISEPPNPWIAGVGNLFAAEFYRTAAEHLTPGGLFAQWFHAYEFNDRLAATLIATFRSVFPHTILFNGNSQDFILVGARQPVRPNLSAMEARIKHPAVAADLDRIHIRTLAAFLSRQTHAEDGVAKLATGARLNTEDRPVLEFLAPNAQYAEETAQILFRTDERLRKNGNLLLNGYCRLHGLSREDLLSVIDCLVDTREGNPELARRALHAYVQRWPKDALYVELLARVEGELGLYTEAYEHARIAQALGDASAGAVAERAWTQLKRGSVWDTANSPRVPAVPGLLKGNRH